MLKLEAFQWVCLGASHTLLPLLLCVCVCMLLCVSHAGVATCIADDAIWCPNAAPTAKYAPVVVFTPSLKRDWDTGTGMGIGVLFLRALPW